MRMDVRADKMDTTFERNFECDLLFVAVWGNEVEVRYVYAAQR